MPVITRNIPTVNHDQPIETLDVSVVRGFLSNELRVAMKEHSLSRRSLAKKLGTSPAAIDRLLSPNDDQITLGTIEKVSKFLDNRIKLVIDPR